MQDQRLRELLDSFSNLKMAVLGDFFLDLYLDLDRSLSELSLETRKEAYQAVHTRAIPGAAGVAINNLAALGVEAGAYAYIGADGFGYELSRKLKSKDVDVEGLLQVPDRCTPTYIKPIMTELDGTRVELNRIDIKNHRRIPEDIENDMIALLQNHIQDLSGVLVLEQVGVDEFGTVTPRLRDALFDISETYPEKVIGVDSRKFSSLYRGAFVKINLGEACRAVEQLQPGHLDGERQNDLQLVKICQKALWEQNKKPVFITLGEKGISGFGQGNSFYHPGFSVPGPVDIVGAGDAVMAAIGASLSAGARPTEAAYVGNLMGSIIIQQIGQTGTAAREDIWKRHKAYQEQINQ